MILAHLAPPCNQTTEHGPRSVSVLRKLSVLRKQFHGARSTEMVLRGCFRGTERCILGNPGGHVREEAIERRLIAQSLDLLGVPRTKWKI